MTLRINRILRFWIECEYRENRGTDAGRSRAQLIATILREYEEAGDAMRYLNADGRIAWKATPKMLSKLADAEREAKDDLSDCL
jgi:hypothetical protein